MTSMNTNNDNSKNLNKKGNQGEYYLDLTSDQKTELEVAQRQMNNGNFITIHDLDKKVSLWLS